MNIEQCTAAALSSLPPSVLRQFADSPLTALETLGLTVEHVEQLTDTRRDGGVCDGTSFLQHDVILYRPTPNSRRENFTLAHELGHYLVDKDEQTMDWLGDQPQTQRLLETTCDRIAQALLLPNERVTAVVGGPISADTVLDLYESTQASRPACAIAVAARLPGLGAVVFIDPATNQVSFSSVRPDPEHGWPEVFPWASHPVPAGHPLKAIPAGGRLTRRSYWETPWGNRQPFYIDALHEGRRIIAIFSETDLWDCEKLHIEPQRTYLDRPIREVTCCGSITEFRGFPCSECDGGYCPTCRQCRCEKLASQERPCRRCFALYQPHLLVDGLCEEHR